MVHPGLPWAWALPVLLAIAALGVWALIRRVGAETAPRPLRLGRLSLSELPLTALRAAAVTLFVLVVAAGFLGSPVPSANIATVLTWTVWWTLVVISVLVVGTSWCSVCPWNTLATLLVRRRMWGTDASASSLDLKVPRWLRSVWPAFVMLCGLTWLELGLGVTQSPQVTAALAVVMVVLATLSLAVFERGAFCRYICPVGRTLGCYSQLAPIELRPAEQSHCDSCTTLECYHGTKDIEPCPAGLTMGRFAQSTYCLSCGACALSCPHDNVAWRLRPMAHEAATGARPHGDEAWFMLGLLALASFHGLTMLPAWDDGIRAIGRLIGDSPRLLASFSVIMALGLALPMAAYAAAAAATARLSGIPLRRLFSGLAFAVLPLAFTDHIAHNLTHLIREGVKLRYVLVDPLGQGPLPDAVENHRRMAESLLPDAVLFTLQAGLLLAGFALAMVILRRRGLALGLTGWRLGPMVVFLAVVAAANTWLLTYDMIMRM
jgi:polyferredoxin